MDEDTEEVINLVAVVVSLCSLIVYASAAVARPQELWVNAPRDAIVESVAVGTAGIGLLFVIGVVVLLIGLVTREILKSTVAWVDRE